MITCPVCSSQKSKEILSLHRQPIYQHPVSSVQNIEQPYFKDLVYLFCNLCEHSFQKEVDISVLEKIYKDYYYTPRPPDIGVQFQNDFMQALIESFDLFSSVNSILEVGCSSGEILTHIAKTFPNKMLAGFEPSRKTAQKAMESGFVIYQDFFTSITSQKIKKTVDLIFHRHVIEHVFEFEDFFDAHKNLCHGNTRLIIETPCLNWAIENLSMAPFHIEHVHVFSIQSLKRLLEKYNWYLKDYIVTSQGNMIGLFIQKECNRSIPEVENPFKLNGWIKKNKKIIETAIKGKKLALWGAGAGGIRIVNSFNLRPDIVVDSNPEKAGKKFVGYEYLEIVEANPWVKKERENSRLWVVIVASTFYEEIYQCLKVSGWEGEIVQPYSIFLR